MITLGEGLFGAALMLSWANSALHILWSDRPFYMHSARVLQGRAPRAGVIGLLTLAFTPLVVWFTIAQDWRAALPILASIAAIRRWEIAQWPDNIVVRLGKYAPAAASLLAWLCTRAVGGLFGADPTETARLGWNAACGVIGGAYLLAAIAKVREAGWVWMHPRYQALLVAERAFSGPRLLRGLRWAVARSTFVSSAMGITGMLVEFGGALFVVPELRPAVAAAVVALHIGFVVLLGYIELEWVLVVIAITLMAA